MSRSWTRTYRRHQASRRTPYVTNSHCRNQYGCDRRNAPRTWQDLRWYANDHCWSIMDQAHRSRYDEVTTQVKEDRKISRWALRVKNIRWYQNPAHGDRNWYQYRGECGFARRETVSGSSCFDINSMSIHAKITLRSWACRWNSDKQSPHRTSATWICHCFISTSRPEASHSVQAPCIRDWLAKDDYRKCLFLYTESDRHCVSLERGSIRRITRTRSLYHVRVRSSGLSRFFEVWGLHPSMIQGICMYWGKDWRRIERKEKGSLCPFHKEYLDFWEKIIRLCINKTYFSTMNLIFLWIYMIIIIVIFAFIAIVVRDIGNFKEYSKYLPTVLKIYLASIIIIAIFWAYKISTHYTPPKKSRTPAEQVHF